MQERLDVYKILTKKIREGETETEYTFGYRFNMPVVGDIIFEYRNMPGHLVVERYFMGVSKVMNVFRKGQEKEAKDSCYKKMVSYVRKNTRFLYGQFWYKSNLPIQHKNGNISIVSIIPKEFFWEKTPEQKRIEKLNRLDDYNKWKVTNLRVKHGLSPLESKI